MTDVVTDGSEEQFSCDFNVEVDINPLKGRVYCHCKLSKNLRINFCWKMFVVPRLLMHALTRVLIYTLDTIADETRLANANVSYFVFQVFDPLTSRINAAHGRPIFAITCQ